MDELNISFLPPVQKILSISDSSTEYLTREVQEYLTKGLNSKLFMMMLFSATQHSEWRFNIWSFHETKSIAKSLGSSFYDYFKGTCRERTKEYSPYTPAGYPITGNVFYEMAKLGGLARQMNSTAYSKDDRIRPEQKSGEWRQKLQRFGIFAKFVANPGIRSLLANTEVLRTIRENIKKLEEMHRLPLSSTAGLSEAELEEHKAAIKIASQQLDELSVNTISNLVNLFALRKGTNFSSGDFAALRDFCDAHSGVLSKTAVLLLPTQILNGASKQLFKIEAKEATSLRGMEKHCISAIKSRGWKRIWPAVRYATKYAGPRYVKRQGKH